MTRSTLSNKQVWGAVLSMSLCAFALVASEFLPVSLLTPIAHELSLSEGQAGQAISVSGFFAVLTSLSVSTLTRRFDRKKVILTLTALMVASGVRVSVAPTYTVLMLGRARLGVSIGGCWSMSTAVMMRIAPDAFVPRAIAVVQGGSALATAVAALQSNPDQRRSLGQAARQRVEQHFTLDRMVAEYRQVYERLS